MLSKWIPTAALCSLFTISTFVYTASAMPKPISVTLGRPSPPISSGVVTGGRAEDEFTLLKVTVESGRGGSERWSFIYGDRLGRPWKKQPGFFHLSVDREAKRVALDLAQVQRTAVDRMRLAKIAAQSKYVAESDVVSDPQDLSTGFTLITKTPVEVSASVQDSGDSRIILELRPATGVQGRRL